MSSIIVYLVLIEQCLYSAASNSCPACALYCWYSHLKSLPFTISDTWGTSMSWSCSQYQGQEAGASQRPRVGAHQRGNPTPQSPTMALGLRNFTSLEGCRDVGWMTSGSLTSVEVVFLIVKLTICKNLKIIRTSLRTPMTGLWWTVWEPKLWAI